MKNLKSFVLPFLLMCLFSSCDDYNSDRRYIQRIVNSSDYDIIIRSFDTQTDRRLLDISINKGQIFEKDSVLFAGDIWTFRDFLIGDSAQIIFPDGKIFSSKCSYPTPENPLGEGCFTEDNIFSSATSELKEGKKSETLTNIYTITNLQYEKAE
jgi:hypothetical protein